MTPSIVALIPARAGSKRVPGKNTRLLNDWPLIRYTISAALEAGIFADVCVVTEDDSIARTAMQCGNVRVMARSAATAADDAPDILWVREFFEHNSGGDAFAILRPTSPFRTAEPICRAWAEFLAAQPCDSLRAVQPAKEHPAKMWFVAADGSLEPWVPYVKEDGTPWHSMPTQSLPPAFVQNASLEIAWTRVVAETGTISGSHIMPFFYPTLDINTEADWDEAERILEMRGLTGKQPLEYLG